jgi:acyl-CoA synthetase (NDP forming)
MMSDHLLEPFFTPSSVAVIGASDNVASHGYHFMKHMLSYGFKGQIYPINPGRPEVMGLKSYPDIEHVPGTIDYVICTIGLETVPDILVQCSHKNVKAFHLYAGRASETGRPEAKKLDAEILKKARQFGIKLLGPNCMGVYCPKGGLSFAFDFPTQSGDVGVVMQSGGSATELVRFASLRGVRFSKVVSYGNALDTNESELFDYFVNDPETKVILCYLEGLKSDGRKFLDLIRKAARTKPTVVCKGGRGKAGSRWAMSHTASLAGSARIWETAIRQAGAVPVRDTDEMVNMAAAFSLLAPVKGYKVAMGGGGGGRNVLAADEWEEHGFEVPTLPQEIREEFKKKGSRVWDWVDNPADWSIFVAGDPYNVPNALTAMSQHPNFDLVVATVAEDHPYDKERYIERMKEEIDGLLQASSMVVKPFIIIVADRSLGINEMDNFRFRLFAQLRTELVAKHIPFFPSVDQAALSIKEVIGYYRQRR